MTPDRLERLLTLRDRLESELPDASAATLPALARELRMVLAELDSEPYKEVNPLDDLASKRAARLSDAQVPDRAGAGDVGGGRGG